MDPAHVEMPAAELGRVTEPAGLGFETTVELSDLNDAIAQERGQSLAQLALAWALRDPRVTSLTIGASRVEQLEQNIGALDRLDFTDAELAAIDELAQDEPGVDLWAQARDSRG